LLPILKLRPRKAEFVFMKWMGDSGTVLFSHPKDFAPVCTTKLRYIAKVKHEFDRRKAKVIGLSVDPIDKHEKRSEDIRQTQVCALNYPLIADTELGVSKLYGILLADLEGSSESRTGSS